MCNSVYLICRHMFRICALHVCAHMEYIYLTAHGIYIFRFVCVCAFVH